MLVGSHSHSNRLEVNVAYFKELLGSRELFLNLTMREVKGQYKRAILGQLWSLVNPLVLMVIYTFIFGLIFRATPGPGDPSGLNVFAVWLLCGLLPWTFFAIAVNSGMRSLVDNAGLIQKVYFMRVVLPLSVIGAAAYNWLFEMAVLILALAVFGSFIWPWIPLVIVLMFLLMLFAAGIALMLSVANVHFRDTQHFTGLLLNFWMYLTPIVYPMSLVATLSEETGPLLGTNITLLDLYRLNPMERFVEVFRNLMYDNRFPTLDDSVFVIVATAVSITLGLWVFQKNERGLAEAL